MTPDVNVLVAAARDDHPHHAITRPWLARARAEATRGAPFVVLPMVAVGFVRVVTNGRTFAQPNTVEDALGFLDTLSSSSSLLGPEWPRFAALCTTFKLTGPIVSDVWIAAAVLHLGEHLVTLDRDFRRLLPPERLTVLTPDHS